MTKEERLQKQKERLAEMKQPEAELHKAGWPDGSSRLPSCCRRISMCWA